LAGSCGAKVIDLRAESIANANSYHFHIGWLQDITVQAGSVIKNKQEALFCLLF